ncbi:hypothetical protein [Bacillus sp. FJAT-44742]|uniref:hypothetical protein n=1 Tax=Bacillus sp. FJAT-44742 TaxID=2014005 RepID=UPI001E36D458|nr:hypothetical protein [Bacillus sp. FJAT-44742]
MIVKSRDACEITRAKDSPGCFYEAPQLQMKKTGVADALVSLDAYGAFYNKYHNQKKRVFRKSLRFWDTLLKYLLWFSF